MSIQVLLRSPTALMVWRLIALATISTVLLVADDFLQQLYTDKNQAIIELTHLLGMFGFSVGLWWCGSRWLVLLVLGLFAFMQLFQLANISYVGQPLNPIDLSRMASEWGEITEVGGAAVVDHWPVLLAGGLPYAALFWLFWTQQHKLRLPGRLIAVILVLAALLSKPYWAMTHNLVQFMPGPTRSSLYNSLGSYSYYAVRLSFGRSRVPDVSYPAYTLVQTPVAEPPRHLWILLGETLRGDRMGIYGYSRDNTPRLSALVKAGNMQVVPGIAGAVSTGVSIPLFVNGVVEPGNDEELRRRVGNLFSQAKRAGYHTFWLSTQESKLLNDLNPEDIDTIFTKASDPLAVEREGDRLLLRLAQELPTDRPTFGILNMRAAHAPYENRYAQEASFTPAWPLSGPHRLSNSYDNALNYVDGVIADLLKLQNEYFSGNRAFVVTADHGEALGEGGFVGHNLLMPEVASVPMLLATRWNDDSPPKLPAVDYLTHTGLHQWVLGLLGARLDNPSAKPGLAYLHGVDFYADNFYVKVTPDRFGNPQLGPRQQVGDGTPLP